MTDQYLASTTKVDLNVTYRYMSRALIVKMYYFAIESVTVK